MNIWCAYQETEDERDEGRWDGDGTENRDEAEEWLRDQESAGNFDAQVAIIDCDHDYCIDVITTDDI